MVLHATDDPFGNAVLAQEVATALGARFAPIDGGGHFWPFQAQEAATAALSAFWADLP
jgi:predicted alpha/beta hydrolase family esterase